MEAESGEHEVSDVKGGSKGGSKGSKGGRGRRHCSRSPREEAALDVPQEHACGNWSWSDHRSRRPRRGSKSGESKLIPCKFGAHCTRKDDEEHRTKFSHPKPEAEESSSRRGVCWQFARGLCTRGDRCRWVHAELPDVDGVVIRGETHGAKANAEVFEELLAESSGVRAVYGQGGEVTTILFTDECISVVVRAQADISETDLRALLSKYGALRALSFEGKGHSGKAGGAKGKGSKSDTGEADSSKCKGDGKGSSAPVAFATFMDKSSAAHLLTEWRSQVELLSVEAGGVRPPCVTEPITGYLFLKWDVGDVFENISDDEDGFDDDPMTWNCTACTLTNPVGALSCGACEQSCPRRVTRMALDEALRMCVPMLDEGPELEPFYYVKQQKVAGKDRKFYNRGFRVHYAGGVEDVQRALRAWQNARARKPTPEHFDLPLVKHEMQRSLFCSADYFAAVHMDRALFDWWTGQEPNLLQAAIGRANKNSVKATLPRRTRGDCVITLKGQSIPQLLLARGQILEVIASEVFSHPRKDMLFTAPGRKRLRDCPFFVETRFRTCTVRVYGTPDIQKLAKDALQTILTDLGTLVRLDFVIRARGMDCKKLKADLELAEDPELRGRNLTLWAPAGHEDVCREHMDPWLPNKTGSTAAIKDEAMCALCFCEFDDAKHTLLGCGHTFCTGCLENCLREPSATHFPLLCQGPSPVVDAEALPCKQPICWADLVRLAPPESLAAIKEIAVQTYLLANPAEGVYCGGITGSGCNALVRPEDGQVACAQCGEAYCVNCSTLLKKVVALHPTMTCEQAQLEARLGVQEHRQRIIDEFLTIRCPKCATAFSDFSACAALTCSSCNTHFCGKCIKDYFPSSEEAHAHVWKCTDGGALKKELGYFIPIEDWHKNNLRRAQKQVEDYLKALDLELREAVIHACELDFLGRPGGDLVISAELMSEAAEDTPAAKPKRATVKVAAKPMPRWR